MVETDAQEPGAESTQAADQEWLQQYLEEHHGELGPGSAVAPTRKKSDPLIRFMLVLLVALVGVAAFMIKNPGLSMFIKPPETIDLGQGISNETGLRGHMVVHWKDKAANYQLKIEPIDERNNDGFDQAAAMLNQPVTLQAHIFDKSGTETCTKNFVLPAPGSPVTPSGSGDPFTRLRLKDSTVIGLWAEGALPCTAEQYRNADYWSFTTTFPTVSEQAHLLGRKPPVEAAPEAAPAPTAQVAQRVRPAVPETGSSRRRAPKKPPTGFNIQGDDQVTAFEAGRAILVVGAGKTFALLRPQDHSIASDWADSSALVHYICDQHALCTLRHAGTQVVARMNN